MAASPLANTPIAAIISSIATLVLALGGRGAWIALRKDRRDAAADDVRLTDLLRAAAADTVQGIRDEMNEMRQRYDARINQLEANALRERNHATHEINRLNKRIAQLENSIRAMPGGVVPSWPNE